MGSQEWMDMIDQEIKELQRLIDRKAESQQIAKFKLAYESSQKKKYIIKLEEENAGTRNSNNDDSSSKSQKESSDDSSNVKENQKKTPSPVDSLQSEYHFGHDLHNDFKTLFGAFNRVAKNKLDRTVLSDFASVSFIDSLYEKKSIEFSSQLTDSYHLYYRLFDEKITNLSNKITQFHQTVTAKIDEMDSLTKTLRNRLNKMFISRQMIAKQEKDEEDLSEIISLNESEEIKTSRSDSRLIPSSRSSQLELNNNAQKKFAKTIVIKRSPLMPHPKD